MLRVIDLYKHCNDPENDDPIPMFPPFEADPDNPAWYDFWANTYFATEDGYKAYDREFARRYRNFFYYDFLEADNVSDALEDFWYDVVSIMQLNQKKYQEMYRIFVLSDNDMPITYNYDMTETTGAQKQTSVKGSQENTFGARTDTIGAIDSTHKVAPFNTTTPQTDSQDITAQRQDTTGTHTDTEGTRTDTVDTNAWTLTRRGNIGTQTAADVAGSFVKFFDNNFKFVLMIFEDVCKQLLMIEG